MKDRTVKSIKTFRIVIRSQNDFFIAKFIYFRFQFKSHILARFALRYVPIISLAAFSNARLLLANAHSSRKKKKTSINVKEQKKGNDLNETGKVDLPEVALVEFLVITFLVERTIPWPKYPTFQRSGKNCGQQLLT